MGELVNGVWAEKGFETDEQGSFKRKASTFREKDPVFAPGRYHLYASLACPWAHRALIFRILKGLEGSIGLTLTDPYMGINGWWFPEPEPLYGYRYLHQIYTAARPDFSGRVTVPVLWDRERRTIVNNESADVIRIFNRWGKGPDFAPEDLVPEIDRINELVYENVNNGVYRAGFATRQAAYETAYARLFEMLDVLEQRLSQQRYLCGDRLTEADWRLFTTLFRFDAVYYGHFKCNKKRIQDYPNLSGFLRELYQIPGVAGTCSLDHIKRHYYGSHRQINPTGIVPLGPEQDLLQPHSRAHLAAR
ncbi:MAG: glutathione S-transferase family protein [Polyangia bacterium]